VESFLAIAKERGFDERDIAERFEFFGGFEGVK